MGRRTAIWILSLAVLGLVGYLYIDHSSRIVPHDPALMAPFTVHESAKGGGLRSASQSFWGASGVPGPDGRYHLYASRMGRACGLEAWDFNSEIVRATAEHPLGPYTVEETVIPAMAHNPVVIKGSDGTYYLFYIGRELSADNQIKACESGKTITMTREQRKHPTEWTCQINVRQAQSPEGPWGSATVLTRDRFNLPLCSTNPAPVMNDDGSVDLYYRAYRFLVTDDKSDKSRYHPYPQEWLYKTSADSATGPFERFTLDPILQGQGEDAFVWRDKVGTHMIFNNKFNDKVNMGGYAFSQDGGEMFRRGVPIYSEQVTYLDGSEVTVSRRERPQIMWLTEDKAVLFQGVRPERKSDWVYTLATPIGDWSKEELQDFERRNPFQSDPASDDMGRD